MDQDDVNLQSITFLELLQLYLGCDLPTPVQLYTSFEPNRFIGRYSAISNELKMQNERRKRTAVAAEGDIQHVNGDEEAEEEDVRNEDGEEEYLEEAYDNDDGYGGAEQRSEVVETRKRSEEEDTLRDRRAPGHEDDGKPTHTPRDMVQANDMYSSSRVWRFSKSPNRRETTSRPSSRRLGSWTTYLSDSIISCMSAYRDLQPLHLYGFQGQSASCHDQRERLTQQYQPLQIVCLPSTCVFFRDWTDVTSLLCSSASR